MSAQDFVKGRQDGRSAGPRSDIMPYPRPENDYQRGFNQGIADFEMSRNAEEENGSCPE